MSLEGGREVGRGREVGIEGRRGREGREGGRGGEGREGGWGGRERGSDGGMTVIHILIGMLIVFL